ncbi:hypothetical protein K438DRAFT_1959331 [Mycena galopus ATCC 62051]|nr:hypothetical protein K438DRAFT_1959331 [Mycena galopus ATCC 62051]
MNTFLHDNSPLLEIEMLPVGSPSQFGMVPVPDRAKSLYPHAETVARDQLQIWSDKSLETTPGYPRYEDLKWNPKWLSQGKLVCSARSALKLKSLVALHPDDKEVSDLLEFVIRFGIPFAIFVKRSRVHDFRDVMIPPLLLRTMGSIYEPGFQDISLEWSRTRGSAAAFNVYKSNVGTVLSRPEGASAVACGGVIRYVAELFDPDIV